MVDEEGKKEDKFDEFDDTGEALGYISLEQARVLAMRTAREEPGSYGSENEGVEMAFSVLEEQEGEERGDLKKGARRTERIRDSKG